MTLRLRNHGFLKNSTSVKDLAPLFHGLMLSKLLARALNDKHYGSPREDAPGIASPAAANAISAGPLPIGCHQATSIQRSRWFHQREYALSCASEGLAALQRPLTEACQYWQKLRVYKVRGLRQSVQSAFYKFRRNVSNGAVTRSTGVIKRTILGYLDISLMNTLCMYPVVLPNSAFKIQRISLSMTFVKNRLQAGNMC